MQVSVLGFGAAEIGYEHASPDAVKELLAKALDGGLNVIDTAACYFDSEEKIGKFASHRRDEFYLFTKCGHKDDWTISDWSMKGITTNIDNSLKRMKTDYLDLVQLHSCSKAELSKGEVIEALEKAKKAGKTRFIGYSGDSTDALYAINTGAFDSLQTSVNIADQEALELTIPTARERGMGIIAKRPIANAVWRSKTKPENAYIQPYWERLQKLRYEFINGSSAQSAERALRFTLAVDGVHCAIVGTTKPGRWEENAKLLEHGPLSKNEFDDIRSVWKSVSSADWVGQV